MFYTFIGGPLDGVTKEIDPQTLVEGTYIQYEVGDAEGLSLLGPITEHRYLAVLDQMHYCTPEKLT